ncbi:MAG: pyruvate, phosphate dikinase [Phycisphaerae bacterium]|nr:pyruvate, phosphate dikinase [Phycisphaerae bacterium]
MQVSTGLPALDRILHGIRPGDNIVWQVDSIDDYIPFVELLIANAKFRGAKLVYFRFAKHAELVRKDTGAQIHYLCPEAGFEAFIGRIHEVIKRTGRGGYYVFDSLSELAMECYSERMLGNFFRLTCPYLSELETVAYFAVLRDYHSYHAALPIAQTTQLLLDVYRHKGKTYVHPLKVHQRHSATMFVLHAWEGDDFVPVTESSATSDILTSAPWPGLQSASYRMVGMWDRRFMQAEELLKSHDLGECSKETIDKVFHRQLRQLISRDERILALAEKYLSLSDIIHLWKRLIGSGLVGGKVVGMLLGRAILEKSDARWAELLEAHDSFFIGSDIFYSYLVENDCWQIRQNQKDPTTLLDGAEEARQRILRGNFPDYITARFSDMLDYFGQSPIIVRSSSLLEDNFGNSFSGKYESVFCANQGTQQNRLAEFTNAVRFIYASSMSEEALVYRAERNILEQDEQMALLVQRVSGKPYKNLFFPQLAGVGLSYNPYVWDESIDPEAGILRLVFGLGTRAVNRSDDDYTRVVALNAPDKRPEAGFDEVAQHAQRRMDMLDLEENRFASGYFVDVAKQSPELPVEMFASPDRGIERSLQRSRGSGTRHWVLTFDKVLSKTPFVKDMRELLKILKKTYGCHVDIEFTANFSSDNSYKINLLQCRPLQIREGKPIVGSIPPVKKENLIMEAHGGIVGQSRMLTIDQIIYVIPSVYGHLPQRDRYSVARLIGRLTHPEKRGKAKTILLLGPGRWGTSTPSLGVPVSFSEINTVSVLCEIDTMHEGLTPDLSVGTHFFNDFVERDMLYIGFSASKKQNILNQDLLNELPNRLDAFLPEVSTWSKAVRVIDAPETAKISLIADHMRQKAVVYIDTKQE